MAESSVFDLTHIQGAFETDRKEWERLTSLRFFDDIRKKADAGDLEGEDAKEVCRERVRHLTRVYLGLANNGSILMGERNGDVVHDRRTFRQAMAGITCGIADTLGELCQNFPSWEYTSSREAVAVMYEVLNGQAFPFRADLTEDEIAALVKG